MQLQRSAENRHEWIHGKITPEVIMKTALCRGWLWIQLEGYLNVTL